MGLIKLNQRLQDPELTQWFANIFPRDNPKNMRFSINFFTSIGLGGLTDALREHLAALPRILAEQRGCPGLLPSRVCHPSTSSHLWEIRLLVVESTLYRVIILLGGQAATPTSPNNPFRPARLGRPCHACHSPEFLCTRVHTWCIRSRTMGA